MTQNNESHNGQAQQLFEAIKAFARACDEAPEETLAQVHSLVGDYFMAVTEPAGRRDNTVEQRVLGTLWAEIEEVIDLRTHTLD